MNFFKILALALFSGMLAGCESTGWQWNGAPDIFTPGASAETKVRTWDADGKPHERTVKSEPAFLYDIDAQQTQR